jgi:hypothetical protein
MVAANSSFTATYVSKPGRATKRLTSSSSAQLVNNHHHATSIVSSNSKGSTSDYALFDRKIEIACEGLSSYYSTRFYKIPLKENALTLAIYIISMKSEINPSNSYRIDVSKKYRDFQSIMVKLYSKI